MKTDLKIQGEGMLKVRGIIFHKYTFLFFSFMFVSILSMNAQSGIEGQWKDMEKGSTILIYQEDGMYFGQLVSSDNPKENEKIKEQDKILIVRSFEKKSDTEFCCGKIFQPKMKKEIPATIVLADENTLKINVKYRGIKRTREWTKL